MADAADENGGGPRGPAGTDHDGNELFTMQKVLDMKVLHGKTYYLIEWAGYESESSWEPASSIMKDAASQQVIRDFLKSSQGSQGIAAAPFKSDVEYGTPDYIHLILLIIVCTD